MGVSSAEKTLRDLLAQADVRIQGNRPWDIQVHHAGFYDQVLSAGSLGLGESYMDGWWDCESLDRFFDRVLRVRLDRQARKLGYDSLWRLVRTKILNAQRRSKAHVIGERHYDLGNNLFAVMLDKWMNYSCGFWENAESLEEAQIAKLELICRKMGLRPGMKVLDIGCGWGGFAKYAVEKYGARVHGITVSREQRDFALQFCRGLDVTIDLMDYRELNRRYDRIVSIGMFEHVGSKNYATFFKVVHGCLDKKGLFLLHTIAANTSTRMVEPWVEKYIFPNSMLPSASQITVALEGLFVLEHWHSFGQFYDKTLMAWYDNFRAHWSTLQNAYDERFYRMWSYYLLSSAGSFRARRNQLWQIVFSKRGVIGGYRYSGSMP